MFFTLIDSELASQLDFDFNKDKPKNQGMKNAH